MNRFETKIDYLKYATLKEVAREAWEGNLVETVLDIPKRIVPGKTSTMRCCVYKERAIIQERIKLATGGNRRNPNIIQVIDIACDECPIGGYEVTNSCRGCLAQRCKDACPKDAISFDPHTHQAIIDKTKCVNCGACSRACQYSAIANRRRPCEGACPVKAIAPNEEKISKINHDKCTNCGYCISQCPFGAIMDKSFILDAIDYILRSENNTRYKVHAIVAPAIADSFKDATFGQLVTALKKLGFYDVLEVALGADMVGMMEAQELTEKGFLFSSCCPGFVSFVKKNYPDLAQYISHTPSPMAALGQHLRKLDPDSKIIFIGPCTAKKEEIRREDVRDIIDVALTFEELLALFDSRDITPSELEEEDLKQASPYGRAFAASGGVAAAIKQGLKEIGSPLEFKPEICSGLDECKIAMLKKRRNILQANFVEGMACKGGCIYGAGVLNKFDVKKANVDKYAGRSPYETIKDSVEAAEK
ncbi:MAG: 4Fe-4S dicluster domain-containing protein [Erysipelotrichaceae bacterium]|nr:4Fe-4S dicluster domain-containing protein [Erysipelotrichaceae bacterium]